MRVFLITLSLTLLVTAAVAQEPAAPGRGRGRGRGAQPEKTYASLADIQALIAEAKSEHKEGQGLLSKRLLTLAPIQANLEYRTSNAPAAIHEKEAELFYVIDGSGTITTGGKLTDEKRLNPENLNGTGIEGGTARDIVKGEFVLVPEGVPHWFSKINGTLVLMSLHIPRSAPVTP